MIHRLLLLNITWNDIKGDTGKKYDYKCNSAAEAKGLITIFIANRKSSSQYQYC